MSNETATTGCAESQQGAWRDVFTREELEALLEIRPWRSWLTVGSNWLLIASYFALVAVWPNPLTFLIALFGLGGRQLGCAVMMHEAGHRSNQYRRATQDSRDRRTAGRFPICHQVIVASRITSCSGHCLKPQLA